MRFRNQIDDKNVNGRHVLIDLDNNDNFYKLRNENIVYCKKYLLFHIRSMVIVWIRVSSLLNCEWGWRSLDITFEIC